MIETLLDAVESLGLVAGSIALVGLCVVIVAGFAIFLNPDWRKHR